MTAVQLIFQNTDALPLGDFIVIIILSQIYFIFVQNESVIGKKITNVTLYTKIICVPQQVKSSVIAMLLLFL